MAPTTRSAQLIADKGLQTLKGPSTHTRGVSKKSQSVSSHWHDSENTSGSHKSKDEMLETDSQNKRPGQDEVNSAVSEDFVDASDHSSADSPESSMRYEYSWPQSSLHQSTAKESTYAEIDVVSSPPIQEYLQWLREKEVDWA